MGLAELITLDLKLDSFLAQEIAIGKNTRSAAATSQKNLRNVLRGKESSDPSFPVLLRNADCDFLGGSFARHTKVWPLDDIDVFFPLEGGSLRYVANGNTLPYKVVSDGSTSRLILSKWQTNNLVDSRKVLDGFKGALKASYPATDISVDQHCVNVQFTMEATSESDGIGFDVVPCLLLRPWYGGKDFYLVPDGAGGWMRSNPKIDEEISVELQSFHQGNYRKAVRLLKYWNKKELGNSFQSYYIELVVSKRFSSLKSSGIVIASLIDALQIAFTALQSAYAAGPVPSLVEGAMPVQNPILNDTRAGNFAGDVIRARQAYEQAYNQSSLSSAFATLNVIFGTNFFA